MNEYIDQSYYILIELFVGFTLSPPVVGGIFFPISKLLLALFS